MPTPEEIELESSIDKVGRDAVFARARELGWLDDAPPIWVWRCIVAELTLARTCK